MSFFSDQTRSDMLASLHSAEYQALFSSLAPAHRSKFACLKPNCNSDNIEEESRKYIILQSVIRQIAIRTAAGEDASDVVDSLPEYCNCASPACACDANVDDSSGSGATSGI